MNRFAIREWLRAIPGFRPAPDTPALDQALSLLAERPADPLEVAAWVLPGFAFILGGVAYGFSSASVNWVVAAAILFGTVGLAWLTHLLIRRAVPETERTASKLRRVASRVREQHNSWLNQLGLEQKIRPGWYPLLEEIASVYLRFRGLIGALNERDAHQSGLDEAAHAMDEAFLRALELAEKSTKQIANETDGRAFLIVLLDEMRQTEEVARRRVAAVTTPENETIEALRRSRRRIEEVSDAWDELHLDG